MREIDDLIEEIRDFAIRRDWETFHTPRNLTLALVGEVGELAAELQWKSSDDIRSMTPDEKSRIRLEVADIFIYLMRFSDVMDIDIVSAIREKLRVNEERFPPTR